MGIEEFLETSYTCYHAAENAARLLQAAGFVPADGNEKADKVYRVTGGSLFAARKGKTDGVQMAIAHTDSPSLRLRVHGGTSALDTERKAGAGGGLLETEKYGGGLLRSYLDRRLKIAGRAIVREGDAFVARNVCSDFFVTVPSLAVHLGAGSADEALKAVDLRPLVGDGNVLRAMGIENAADADLYCVPAESPYRSGVNGEYLCAPRIDNLVSVYAAVRALIESTGDATAVIACFNSEETGSETREGAQGRLLRAFVADVCGAADVDKLLSRSFALSCDGAHGLHPAHPEKYGACPPVLGGGVVIKRNDRYASDALTAAVAAEIFARAGQKTQVYYHHPDLRCGSTIGLTAAHTLGCAVCDVGVPQLSMHAAVETAAYVDIDALTSGLRMLFDCAVRVGNDGITVE